MPRHFLPSLLTALLLCGSGGAAAIDFSTPYVTRAESVAIILKTRMKDVPNASANGEYPDVAAGEWYERFLVWGRRYGIIGADADNRMRPDDAVTRAEFLKMLTLAFGLPENQPYLYDDVSDLAWFAPYAGNAQKYALFPADPDQTLLRPDNVLTHAEVARALQIVLKSRQNEDFRGTLIALDQSENQLQLYDRISTRNATVTLIKPPGPAPKRPPPEPQEPAYADPTQVPVLREQILDMVNLERAKKGLNLLARNAALEGSAQKYATSMAKGDFFGHVSPKGQTFRERVEESGYYQPFYQQDCLCSVRYVMAENIARGQKTAAEVMRDWMNSPSHRAAILTPDYTDLGVGIDAGVWVQHFGGKPEIIYDLSAKR